MKELVEKVLVTVEDSGFSREDVRFIFLFGSYLESPEEANDIDIAISLEPDISESAEFKLNGRAPEELDISLFEALPLQVRKEVLTGKLLYSRDDSVYDAAFETLRDFENFKPHYSKAVAP